MQLDLSCTAALILSILLPNGIIFKENEIPPGPKVSSRCSPAEEEDDEEKDDGKLVKSLESSARLRFLKLPLSAFILLIFQRKLVDLI